MTHPLPIDQQPRYMHHAPQPLQAGKHHFLFYGVLLFLIFFNVESLPDIGRIRLIIAGILFVAFLRYNPLDTAFYLLFGAREVAAALIFMMLLVVSAWTSGHPDVGAALFRNFITTGMLMIWAFMLVRTQEDCLRMIIALTLASTGQAILNLAVTMATSDGVGRMSSVMRESAGASMNSIGLTASWGVALANYLFLTKKSQGQRLFWGTMAIFGIIAIFATGCRGAFVLLFLMIFWQLIVMRRQAFLRPSTLFFLGIGITGAIYLISLPQLEAPVNRILTIFDLDPSNLEKMDTYESRQPAARAAVAMWKDYPLAGVGTGSFIPESNPYKDVYARRFEIGPHNMYLLILAENGLIGIAVFITMLLLMAWPLLKYERASFGCLSIFLIVGGMQEHTIHTEHILYIACGTAAALRLMNERERKRHALI